MTLRSIMVFIIPFFIIVGVLSPADSAGTRFIKHCCTSYSNEVNIRHIRSYSVQRKGEHCRIKAIIFLTTSNLWLLVVKKPPEICGNPKDKWVKDTVKSLRNALEKQANN